MERLFISLWMLAIISTAYATYVVMFSVRWRADSKRFLENQFGPGPHDDALVEECRVRVARGSLVIASVSWLLVVLIGGSFITSG